MRRWSGGLAGRVRGQESQEHDLQQSGPSPEGLLRAAPSDLARIPCWINPAALKTGLRGLGQRSPL